MIAVFSILWRALVLRVKWWRRRRVIFAKWRAERGYDIPWLILREGGKYYGVRIVNECMDGPGCRYCSRWETRDVLEEATSDTSVNLMSKEENDRILERLGVSR